MKKYSTPVIMIIEELYDFDIIMASSADENENIGSMDDWFNN